MDIDKDEFRSGVKQAIEDETGFRFHTIQRRTM